MRQEFSRIGPRISKTDDRKPTRYTPLAEPAPLRPASSSQEFGMTCPHCANSSYCRKFIDESGKKWSIYCQWCSWEDASTALGTEATPAPADVPVEPERCAEPPAA